MINFNNKIRRNDDVADNWLFALFFSYDNYIKRQPMTTARWY